MPKQKNKRPTWWKIHDYQKNGIEYFSDEDVGAGFKAALKCFEGETINPNTLSQGAFTVFMILKIGIDDSMKKYQSAVESGKNGAENRWNGN